MIYFHSTHIIAVNLLYSVEHTEKDASFRFPVSHCHFLATDYRNIKALTSLENKRKCKNRFSCFFLEGEIESFIKLDQSDKRQ